MSNAQPMIAEEARPARACLRISLQSVPAGRTEHVRALVGKVVSSFLESRWDWPRQFEAVSSLAFVLTDPSVTRMDLNELKHLARELQNKLFGVEGAGEVDLLVFEGDEVSIHRFAHMAAEALAAYLRGEGDEDLRGEVSRVAANGVTPVIAPAWVADEAEDQDSPSGEEIAPRFEPCHRGAYFAAKQVFTGSLVMLKPFGATNSRGLADRMEIIPGVAAEDYDRSCIEALAELIQSKPFSGHIVTPLCFSNLVRPAFRQTYAEWLDLLPQEQKPRLGALIYDTPRTPSFSGLSQVLALLQPRVAYITVSVADPGFDVESLPPGITTVSYAAQGADTPTRLAGVRRFMAHLPAFKRKRIWPMVDGLRNRTEIDACIALGAPFLMGPAVTDLMSAPPNGRIAPLSALPVRR